MKPTVTLTKYLRGLLTIALLSGIGCATPSNQQPTTVGQNCIISWDKSDDPKVTWFQITVIDQSKQANKTVRFTPADKAKISCKDAGAVHDGLWDVTVQSCYDKSTCGPPTEVIRMHITAK